MEHAITSYGTRAMTWALTIVVVNNPADDAAILASFQATVKTLSHHNNVSFVVPQGRSREPSRT